MQPIFRLLLPALVACAALAGPPTASAAKPCANAKSVPHAENVASIKKATLCLLNRERRIRHLPRLSSNGQLGKAAQRFSASMVRKRFFGHADPAGRTLSTRVRRGTSYLRGGVRRWWLAENLAWGLGELATPKAIVRSWMRSPGHRRNILNRRFRDVGIGVAGGAPRRVAVSSAATYTTNFGARVLR